MASAPNFEELDDVIFGVSTRHQWHQLINQIEATNHANKRGSKKTKNKNKNILQEQNREMFPITGQEQDMKGGAKVKVTGTQEYSKHLGIMSNVLCYSYSNIMQCNPH